MPAPRATCEPCRLRRVKCDLREKVFECTNCTKRGLSCPGVRIPTTKRHRRGVVVDQVEREFGTPSASTPDSLVLALTPVITPAEYEMVSGELRRELNVSMLQSFVVSHGRLFKQISGLRDTFMSLGLSSVPDLGRRLDDLDPYDEVATRVFVALGARTTMHSSILGGGDMAYPLTLGIIREEPCRRLAKLAVERYESLGLWRQASLDAIQVSVLVYFIARSAFTAEFARPFANTAINLMRQYLANSDTPAPAVRAFVENAASMVLWTDARTAAETGSRPLFTAEDLEDYPEIRAWLLRPLVRVPTMDGREKLELLQSANIRLLRNFATRFHHHIRRKSGIALDSLDTLWNEHAALASFIDIEMHLSAAALASYGGTNDDRTFMLFGSLHQLDLSIIHVVMSIWDLLARSDMTGTEWDTARAASTTHAVLELKRVVQHIKTLYSVEHVIGAGPPIWIYMSRIFFTLEITPRWTILLAPDISDGLLTPEEAQIITDGVQQAGWGAEFASERWLDALRARGMLREGLEIEA